MTKKSDDTRISLLEQSNIITQKRIDEVLSEIKELTKVIYEMKDKMGESLVLNKRVTDLEKKSDEVEIKISNMPIINLRTNKTSEFIEKGLWIIIAAVVSLIINMINR